MIAAWSIEEMNAELRRRYGQPLALSMRPMARYMTALSSARQLDANPRAGLVGILFARKGVPLADEQVLPQLNYYHHRSGKNIDFFCAGFSNGLDRHRYGEQTELAKVGGQTWYYCDQIFAQVCEEIEKETRWNYRGGTELILLNSGPRLRFDAALALHFEAAIEDKAVPSVMDFFERTIRFCKSYEGSDPVRDLSDGIGLRVGGAEVASALVPKKAAAAFKKLRHFAVEDVSKV